MYACVYFIPLIVHTIFTATDTVALAPAPMEEAPASGGGCSGEGGGSRIGVAAALLSMVPFAAAAVAMVVNAKLAEAANERHRHAGVPICLAAVMLVLMPLSLRFVGAPVAFICLAMAAACIWSLHGPFMSWPATFLEGPQASIGFAWINSVGSLGGFVGPYVLGVLLDRTGSYSVAMVVLASILLAAGICILFFPVERTLNVQMDEAVPGEAANGGPETDDHWLHKAPASLEREPMLHGAIRSSDL